jgi:hypothetical protein
MGISSSSANYKPLIDNHYFQAWYSGYTCKPWNMKTNTPSIKEQLNACLKEREQVADILQNEVNQILAAALLRMQYAKDNNNNNTADNSFQQPEIYLKKAIDKIRVLHYSLVKEHSEMFC